MNIFLNPTILSSVNVTDPAALFDGSTATEAVLCAGGNASSVVLDLGNYYNVHYYAATNGTMGTAAAELQVLRSAAPFDWAGAAGDGVFFANWPANDQPGTIRSSAIGNGTVSVRYVTLNFSSATQFALRKLEVDARLTPPPPRLLISDYAEFRYKLDWDGVYPLGVEGVALWDATNPQQYVRVAIGEQDPTYGWILHRDGPHVYNLPHSTSDRKYCLAYFPATVNQDISNNYGPQTGPVAPPLLQVHERTAWKRYNVRTAAVLPAGFQYDITEATLIPGVGFSRGMVFPDVEQDAVYDTGVLQPYNYVLFLRKTYDEPFLVGTIESQGRPLNVSGAPEKPAPPALEIIENRTGADFLMPPLPVGATSVNLVLTVLPPLGSSYEQTYVTVPEQSFTLRNLAPGSYTARTVALNQYRLRYQSSDSVGRTFSDSVFFVIPERQPNPPSTGDYGCVPAVPPSPVACIQNLHSVRVQGVSAAAWPACTSYLSFETSADNGATWQERSTNILTNFPFSANVPVCAGMQARFVAHK